MYRLILVSTVAILAQVPDHTYAGNADPKALGCWKDSSPRAIPLLEGKSTILDGSYTVRENPLAKCNDAAAAKGYTIFAVQDGGACLSSSDAKAKYKTYGKSTACNANGNGGAMANNVYEISPLKRCLCLMPKKHVNALPKGKACFDNVATTNAIKRTALAVAARNNHHKCTKILIDSGANIEAVDKDNVTPLTLAAFKSDTLGCESVKALIAAKAKQDTLSDDNKKKVLACMQGS